MNRILEQLGIAFVACGLVVAAGFFLPVFGRTAAVSVQSKNLMRAKQLAILIVQHFPNENGGRLPQQLKELVPDYIAPEDWNEVLFDTRKNVKDRPASRFDWLYFGASFDEKNPPPLLMASPQAFTGGKANKRIVMLGDTTGSVVSEEEFQDLLRKTIEAMRKRAVTPASKPDAVKAIE